MNHRLVLVAAGLVVSGLALTAQQSEQLRPSVTTAGSYKAPRTPDGKPDLQGFWTNLTYTPFERPKELANKPLYTEKEAIEAFYRAIAESQDQLVHYVNGDFGATPVQTGARPNLRTSLVIDPADGRVPALTPAGQARRASGGQGSFGVGPWNKVQDFSLYDRCITRGAIGSFMPAVYGNGARIVQTPNAIVISYEMVHDTRVIPLDNRPPLNDSIHLFMGDSRGHWEGDTLVVESRNFTDRTAVGGARHSENLRMTERFTRIDPDMIDYEIHVDDPDTFVKPWTMRMTITSQPDYQIYEYGCHEGNNAMRNALSAERAYEKAAAEAKDKGLPPPERVFERVNGADRAR